MTEPEIPRETFQIASSQNHNINFYGPEMRLAMMIRFDVDPPTIEVAAGISIDDAAAAVIDALRNYLDQGIEAAAARRCSR